MDVNVKDRKNNIEYLRMVLNLCEIGVNYPQADLIKRIFESLEEKNGNFNLKDGVKLYYEWKQEWEDYFKKIEVNYEEDDFESKNK